MNGHRSIRTPLLSSNRKSNGDHMPFANTDCQRTHGGTEGSCQYFARRFAVEVQALSPHRVANRSPEIRMPKVAGISCVRCHNKEAGVAAAGPLFLSTIRNGMPWHAERWCQRQSGRARSRHQQTRPCRSHCLSFFFYT